MLTNLVENAGKYARQKIELSAHYEKDQLIISIDDDVLAFRKQSGPRSFVPFTGWIRPASPVAVV